MFSPWLSLMPDAFYQLPFIVDSSKITTKLDLHATPIDQALADTLTTYRHD
jgi:hypothetical protein